mmetsp:Transcript_11519/g.46587  ORF Transcript_11519/g.46587 Transcript_11519/m.46587 type:complete len:254 (-) Transcript_11519:296-1057(-)
MPLPCRLCGQATPVRSCPAPADARARPLRRCRGALARHGCEQMRRSGRGARGRGLPPRQRSRGERVQQEAGAGGMPCQRGGTPSWRGDGASMPRRRPCRPAGCHASLCSGGDRRQPCDACGEQGTCRGSSCPPWCERERRDCGKASLAEYRRHLRCQVGHSLATKMSQPHAQHRRSECSLSPTLRRCARRGGALLRRQCPCSSATARRRQRKAQERDRASPTASFACAPSPSRLFLGSPAEEVSMSARVCHWP